MTHIDIDIDHGKPIYNHGCQFLLPCYFVGDHQFMICFFEFSYCCHAIWRSIPSIPTVRPETETALRTARVRLHHGAMGSMGSGHSECCGVKKLGSRRSCAFRLCGSPCLLYPVARREPRSQ